MNNAFGSFSNLVKLATLAVTVVIVQGCTIYFDGLVNNESGAAIKMIGNDADKTSWTVNANDEVKFTWKYKCLQVEDGGQSYFFDADPKSVPKAAVRGSVKFTVHTVYKDHQLYYMLEGGEAQPLNKLESCEE